MNKKYMFAFIAVLVLFLIAWVGVSVGLQWLFGVLIPYLAVLVFVVGFARKVLDWSRSAVPFAIPTTGGQAKSFDWIQDAKFDNPSSKFGVFMRMVFEVLTFRSLFRNTRMKLKEGKLFYQLEIFLWVGALAFHYAFLTVLLRHTRFFTRAGARGACSCSRPSTASSGSRSSTPSSSSGCRPCTCPASCCWPPSSTWRCAASSSPTVRYISLASDFFPLILIFGIAFTGIMMRYVTKIDINAAKQLTMGLVTFHPTVPEGIGAIFYIHLFFVCTLLAYFPYSKLMHLGGIFLSPTRNMLGNTRAYRHVNPWNSPVHVHTYQEYEEEFREKMVEAGLPVDKPLEATAEEAAEKE